MIKTLNKTETEGNSYHIIKVIYEKPIANIILNGERPKAFPLRFRTRHRGPLTQLPFNILLEDQSNYARKR